jgi:hypothetical protein
MTPPRPRRPATALLLLLAVPLFVAGCSTDGDGAAGGDAATTAPATTTTVARPPGPAADLSEELTGGRGIQLAAGTAGPELADAGYVESEVVVAGTATSYRSEGELPADGRFELSPADSAEYRTRAVIRRPADPEDFNGTVVVEWLNVSGGFDANPDYAYMADELLRGGYAWVGVSAQYVGIEGGPVAVGIGGGDAGRGLRASDPERYGSLSHPGDAFSYDIVTQLGRALRQGSGLGDLRPDRVLAVGESQSAFALTTYVNGVQPLTRAFDGVLLHSRGGAAAPLGEPGSGIAIAQAITGPPVMVRTDTEVPVLILQSESDIVSVIGYFPARQDDTDRIRLWEVAGTAHADQFLIGPVADLVDCGVPVNDGPQHLAAKAALRSLDRWVRDGTPPPPAPRLAVDDEDGGPTIRRDGDGIAVGGIRTPQVDVPVDVLSGEPGPSASVICLLLGSTRPLPPERLVELHTDRATYQERYDDAAAAVIDAGFVLPEDRGALLADASPDRFPA